NYNNNINYNNNNNSNLARYKAHQNRSTTNDANTGTSFLLKNVSNIQSERSNKSKSKMYPLNSKKFYLSNCEHANYSTTSLFYSKYAFIIEMLLDSYDELLFYLNKKKFITKLTETTLLEASTEDSEEIIPHDKYGQRDDMKELIVVSANSTLDKEKSTPLSSSQGVVRNKDDLYSLRYMGPDTYGLKDITVTSYEESIFNYLKTNSKFKMNSACVTNECLSPKSKRNYSLNSYTHKSDIISNTLIDLNIPSIFEDTNDICSLYWLNSNTITKPSKCNSLFSNYTSDYFNIPIYSTTTKISSDESTKKEENYFWYYYPGIIGRVYKEWLKCKNLDYKKFNNDFYYLFANSNKLNEFFKSNHTNIEKQEEIKLFDISQVLSSNTNILNKMKTSYSTLKCSNFLSDDILNSNSLNEIISNFLTDVNINLDSSFSLNSKILQSFFEDNNIKHFLSSLYSKHSLEFIDEEMSTSPSKIMQSLIHELDQIIAENKAQQDTKMMDDKKKDYANIPLNEYSDINLQNDHKYKKKENLLNKWDFESGLAKYGKSYNGGAEYDILKEKSNHLNLNSLLSYAESLMIQYNGSDGIKEGLIENVSNDITNNFEEDSLCINSFEEILSNFIKKILCKSDSTNFKEDEESFREKMGSLKSIEEIYSNIKKTIYSEKQLNLLSIKPDKTLSYSNKILLPSNKNRIDSERNDECSTKQHIMNIKKKKTYLKKCDPNNTVENVNNTKKDELI
ncbi:conserved Plasmodium protein, unknown function, partial [Plasmodium malariae]